MDQHDEPLTSPSFIPYEGHKDERQTHQRIQNDIRSLHQRPAPIQHNRAQQPDFLDSEYPLFSQIDYISDIEGMLDEKEDDTREDGRETVSN